MSEESEEIANKPSAVKSNDTGIITSSAENVSSVINDNDNTPRILCNELIINPAKSKSVEKLDELLSLEQEIAKMHHVDDTNTDIDVSSSIRSDEEKNHTNVLNTSAFNTTSDDDPSGENTCKIPTQDGVMDDKLDAITSGETELEHEDLIAVLKGLDSGNVDETRNSGSILEGVTIEGEGEYQIMEVIDEDSNATEDTNKQNEGVASTTAPVIQSLNKTKTFGSTTLTAQEERALALEQIAVLKTVNRRRKQDIKPIKQVDHGLDLLSALEADWSEHEEISETTKAQSKYKQTQNHNTNCENKINPTLITSVVVIPSDAASDTTVSATLPTATTNININVNNNKSSNIEDMKTANPTLIDAADSKAEENLQSVSTQSGFRRTRIIKPKIIWDPDAPETTFSYAKLLKSNSNYKTEQSINKDVPAGSLTTIKKIQRPITPRPKRNALDSNIEKARHLECVSNKNIVEKDSMKLENKTEESSALTSPSPTSCTKRQSQTPISNSPTVVPSVKKKKITEVDRLMGDEGAVNMLNSLEKLEANLGSSEVKSTRPMMRSRAATISEKAPRKDTTSPVQCTTITPPATTGLQSNKGKRTPKSRASSSWDYVYKKKKQDFDDSLIIRRRSNSSYSSTTSLNRLSLDCPPASIANNNVSNSSTKCSDPISTNEHTLPKRSPSASNNSKTSGSSKTRLTPTAHLNKSFEFAKPESKKSQKRTKSPSVTLTSDMKKAAPLANRRNVRTPSITNEDKVKDINKPSPSKSAANIKEKKDSAVSSNTISDVVVKKSSKVAQILFSTNKAKLSNTFTIQMLNKLVDILHKLASEPECHVVVIGTNDAHFCKGIDITDLTTVADEKRKSYALNLASSAKNYLKTLATYPKPIVGAVNGNLMNFGVIQLALFDVVVASDKATFETPYCRMGQTPEGYCIWHNMNKIRGSFKTKLFWLCEKVQSTEAALAGLVNKLSSGNNVNDDALMTAKRIASLSPELYRGMKKTVINGHLDIITKCLDEEFNAIVTQWISTECLENLKKHISQN